MDQLANDYSDKPAFFVEWGSDYYPSNRTDLLDDSGGGLYVPEGFVDSTRIWKTGFDYNYAKYMADNALARPAQGVIEGTWTLNGNTATLNVTVTNKANVALNTANKAAVHGIVYENYRQSKTNRIGRGSAKVDITSLAVGATDTYTINVNLSNVVNPKNLVYLAVVDYKPSGTKDAGVYDQIQAAQLDPKFNVAPGTVDFDFAWDDPTPSAEIAITGTIGLAWTATTDKDWLLIDPEIGNINSNMNVTVNPELLANGNQSGTITIVDATNTFERKVKVNVKYAAFIPPTFTVFPTSISRTIRESDETIQPIGVRIDGDSGQTWTATADKAFISMNPSAGNVPVTLQVLLSKEGLVAGLNEATITFKDGAGHHEILVPVKITYIDDGEQPPFEYEIFVPLVFNP